MNFGNSFIKWQLYYNCVNLDEWNHIEKFVEMWLFILTPLM